MAIDAAGQGKDAIAYLIEERTRGMTPLHRACYFGDSECVQTLIATCADMDAVDSKGRTPIQVAIVRGDSRIVEKLIASGAKIGAGEVDQAKASDDQRAWISTFITDGKAVLLKDFKVGTLLAPIIQQAICERERQALASMIDASATKPAARRATAL